MDEWRGLKIEPKPAAYVFNTQPSHVRFGHWIGVYIRKNGEAIFLTVLDALLKTWVFYSFLKNMLKRGNIITSAFRVCCRGCVVSTSSVSFYIFRKCLLG